MALFSTANFIDPNRSPTIASGGTNYDVTANGMQLVLAAQATGAAGEEDSHDREIQIVQNWFTELERLVPTN